jgi:Rrf2 family nitric oxide-sensitive transcriptional repressor
MIRVNRQTDYAVRVLLALAKRPAGTRASTNEIQREMLIPPAFSQRIVADLARGAFIITYPGRDGGLQLARPAEQTNLRQVVEFFEGPIAINDCLAADFECPFEDKCPVRRRWAHLQGMFLNELESITFEELAQEAESLTPLLQSEPLMVMSE